MQRFVPLLIDHCSLVMATVQQVKLFKGVDSDIAELERQINRWIRKSGCRVLAIHGNLAPHSSSGTAPMNSFAASDVLIIVHVEVETNE